jgi:hypothetical protein
MKVLRGILIAILGVALAAVPTLAASADTISVARVITIHARILPARYIILNDAGVITEIDSNTSEDVQPKVYVHDTHQAANQRRLTAELQREYDQIMAGIAQPGPGVLYKRTAVSMFTKNSLVATLMRAP